MSFSPILYPYWSLTGYVLSLFTVDRLAIIFYGSIIGIFAIMASYAIRLHIELKKIGVNMYDGAKAKPMIDEDEEEEDIGIRGFRRIGCVIDDD